MDVSVRELKDRLSEYLRRVQAGEEVHVTLRGKRIVRLLPEPADAVAEVISRLDAMPWMQAPRREGKPLGASDLLAIKLTTEELSGGCRSDRLPGHLGIPQTLSF